MKMKIQVEKANGGENEASTDLTVQNSKQCNAERVWNGIE